MAKTTTKTAAPAASEKKTREELLAEVKLLEYQQIEITGGKSFPKGSKFEVIKVGVSKWGKPYVILQDGEEERFCDPANVKALKALPPARIALIKASLEESKDAVLILSGIVKNESDNAVLIKHHAWFKPRWFPKKLIASLGEHEDGEQTLFEVPQWKIKADHGPDGVKALQDLQPGFEKMLQPKAVPGKTTVVKKAK